MKETLNTPETPVAEAALRLTEALMDIPNPTVSINTAEMLKVCAVMKAAHSHLLAVYKEVFFLDGDAEYEADLALDKYLDYMHTHFTLKLMRCAMTESDLTAV